MSEPIIRRFTLPNGDVIVGVRESTLRAWIKAAGMGLRASAPTPRPEATNDAADASAQWVLRVRPVGRSGWGWWRRNHAWRRIDAGHRIDGYGRPGATTDGADGPAA